MARPLKIREEAADFASLPAWARPAFPGGLAKQSDGVWCPLDFQFNLAEQARINLAAAPRGRATPRTSLHFEYLLQCALEGGALSLPPDALLLDLRSGNGMRSVVPWLRLAPSARVIASDPAGVLLATLYGHAAATGESDRVLCVVSDAGSPLVAPGSLDLVSGVACLHELNDPDAVIAAAAQALRPGGHAIFLAPFDGFGLMRLAYESIRAEAPLWPDDPLADDVDRALRTMALDIAARTLPDPAEASFGLLEQKWLFSRESLEKASRAMGFADVQFLPHNDHETLYRDMALVQLRDMTARPGAELPAWAIAILDRFDSALRPPVKRLLMLEGTVVLTR